MVKDMATSLLGADAGPRPQLVRRVGFAVALLLSGMLVGTALEKARADGRPTTILASQEPLPAGILEGLEGYTKLFTTMDASLLPSVFHKTVSMSALADEKDLGSFQVMDYKGLKSMLDMFYDVFQGKKPWSSLPAEFQSMKGAVMIGATSPVRHYSLGPNEYVTEIYDRFVRSGEVVVSFHTNLHWINTVDGWRIKDKIYATLP
ncbi:unnamed protein product [Symbiodinium natans]|uniref:SnoaL-like domain-containing protein n=1 Tax=Symbiodinium natans TaxID=878477 RepID=A0A812SNX2_9DINO|nr:unnamed protein product [Symbiodinium natans]